MLNSVCAPGERTQALAEVPSPAVIGEAFLAVIGEERDRYWFWSGLASDLSRSGWASDESSDRASL